MLNDAWSQYGHLALYTTAILTSTVIYYVYYYSILLSFSLLLSRNFFLLLICYSSLHRFISSTKERTWELLPDVRTSCVCGVMLPFNVSKLSTVCQLVVYHQCFVAADAERLGSPF